ncbi:hypothetical protein D0Z07_2572 [Hyphodiscus hymeniophilus]|uniref:Uncharacterized protein n=1 Tax=Hyphodiscus hymeniophilus TaxID=353542 RepID=A0A9P6VLU6_9HELO|nr:hypothetical protein D0Z07_2572 [Hyphodiscus hymeniophilus]
MSKRSSASSSSSSSRTPTKRIITELTAFSTTYTPVSPHPTIASLAPSPSNVLLLQTILTGHSLPSSTGYSSGRWLHSPNLPHRSTHHNVRDQDLPSQCQVRDGRDMSRCAEGELDARSRRGGCVGEYRQIARGAGRGQSVEYRCCCVVQAGRSGGRGRVG